MNLGLLLGLAARIRFIILVWRRLCSARRADADLTILADRHIVVQARHKNYLNQVEDEVEPFKGNGGGSRPVNTAMSDNAAGGENHVVA